MGIYGQDWASYQSATPDTTGLSFAFVKVTEGLTYTNPEWVQQRDHAKAAGLVWGGYHYPHMGNSYQAEADRFLAQVNWQPGDLICLDWEGYDPANTGVSHADQAAYKDAWLKYVKAKMPHNPVGMYCNADYWRNVDTTSYCGDFLWIATAGLPAGSPGIQHPWLFHQYSSSPVDSDYCPLGSTAELRTWALSFQPAPAPVPEEDPLAAFTEADLRRFIQEESLKAVTSQPGRDAVAFAVWWWWSEGINATPNPDVVGTWWESLLPRMVDGLRQLPAPALEQIRAVVDAALKSDTVNVDVSVTGAGTGSAGQPAAH